VGNRTPQAHWLRGNAKEDTPRRLIVLDTESFQSEAEGRELHQLRCWVLRTIEREPGAQHVSVCAQYEGTERAELAELVDRPDKLKGPRRLFTHNLSYDLGLTRLPLDLIAKGWTVGRHNLASESPWAHLQKKSRGLWLCDSWSWLPTSVEKLGEALGLSKPRLPTEADPLEAWLKRCRADVGILSSALLDLMDEWDRRKLGWWSITGPASGWNTMLHFPRRSDKPLEEPRIAHSKDPHAPGKGQRVLIVPDPQARAFERLALYSGRRDVWRVGKLPPGPYAEVDLRQAHLSICAHLPLPYRRWASFDALEMDDWRLDNPAAGLVAEVVLNSHTPRYPLRLKGTVLHPVGQFATVLAGPEIKDARARGELVSIGAGYGYHLGTQMKDWATWALAIINSDAEQTSPMLKMAVRNWGRSVPGRWGMTHARELKQGPSHVDGWLLESITVGSPPRRGHIFHLAGTWTESISDEEADDSFPAVLAYIQSYCRLALNAMIDALPAAALVSCNTEGVWARGEDVPAMEFLSHATAPLEVRIKQTAQRLKVLSPQHHLTEQARLYSGIPRAAEEIRPDQFEFWTWPKLKGQIERGDPRGYVRERRTVNLAGIPVSRWSFQDGACEPVEVTWSAESGNVLHPPCGELLRRHGPLRASQHPALRKVLR
jgi:hypothetical protein